MESKLVKISIKSKKINELINITQQVQDLVTKSKVISGHVILFVPHTTAAITINENTDPNVVFDLIKAMSNVFIDDPEYRHFEGNSPAHIKSTVVGVEKTILIEDNQLVLGIWQGIYFCEFDGPKTRNLMVKVISD